MRTVLTINGFKIHCILPTPVKKQVLRTWKERLSFSKDQLFFWNPFNKYKTVVEYYNSIADGQIIQSGDKVFCNEYTFKELQKIDSLVSKCNPNNLTAYSLLDDLNHISFTEKGVVTMNTSNKETMKAIFDSMEKFT